MALCTHSECQEYPNCTHWQDDDHKSPMVKVTTVTGGTCPACWRPFTERTAVLIDPAGKRWTICAECVSEMWHAHDENKPTDEVLPGTVALGFETEENETREDVIDEILTLLMERLKNA